MAEVNITNPTYIQFRDANGELHYYQKFNPLDSSIADDFYQFFLPINDFRSVPYTSGRYSSYGYPILASKKDVANKYNGLWKYPVNQTQAIVWKQNNAKQTASWFSRITAASYDYNLAGGDFTFNKEFNATINRKTGVGYYEFFNNNNKILNPLDKQNPVSDETMLVALTSDIELLLRYLGVCILSHDLKTGTATNPIGMTTGYIHVHECFPKDTTITLQVFDFEGKESHIEFTTGTTQYFTVLLGRKPLTVSLINIILYHKSFSSKRTVFSSSWYPKKIHHFTCKVGLRDIGEVWEIGQLGCVVHNNNQTLLQIPGIFGLSTVVWNSQKIAFKLGGSGYVDQYRTWPIASNGIKQTSLDFEERDYMYVVSIGGQTTTEFQNEENMIMWYNFEKDLPDPNLHVSAVYKAASGTITVKVSANRALKNVKVKLDDEGYNYGGSQTIGTVNITDANTSVSVSHTYREPAEIKYTTVSASCEEEGKTWTSNKTDIAISGSVPSLDS